VFDLRIYNEEHSIPKLQSKLETVKPNAVKLSAKDLEKNSATNTTKKILMLNETGRRSTMNREESQKDLTAGAPGSGSRRVEHRPNIAYKIHQDYNLAAFNSAIANLDMKEVARRRKIYNFLYTEAVMSMEPIPGSANKKKGLLQWRAPSFGPSAAARSRAATFEMQEMGGEDSPGVQMGISFQKMLIIMAHYKLIEDDQCLSIGDLLRHRQKMDRIHARVNAMNVQRVLLKVILRQRFLKHYRAVQRIQELATEGEEARELELAHSSRESVSTDQTASTHKKHVRIHTGESEGAGVVGGRGQRGDAGASPVVGTRSRNNVVIIEPEKTALEDDESIDPEQAGAMIDNLRSEWRCKFIIDSSLVRFCYLGLNVKYSHFLFYPLSF